ncbi:hypothetical protein U1Q18_021490 [Sarracenia purpurea var. burkii]
MKFSLKVQDQHRNPQSHHQPSHHHQNPLLFRAKVPISVFGLPFLSGVAATDNSDLSFSLRSNFPSGPSLKLSYTPAFTTTTATTAATAATATTSPLTLTLKSGVSLFGSPNNSPLIISADFTFSPQNPNPIPTFSLQIKPHFGDFSLHKTTYSSPNPYPKANDEISSMGFVPLEKPRAWKDLTLDSSYKDSLLSGIAVMAKTTLPVMMGVAINCRWGVNFPADISKKLPFLTVNKIGIERVEKVKEVEVKNSQGNVGDLELLKGFCVSVGRELEVLQKENREIKQSLGDIRFGKKALPLVENSSDFEQWRSKKSDGEENRKESKKNVNQASDVESELQKAIKAASF